MKYWFDTEFIEDGKTIDLISIGIVSEDGREYYAESYDCDYDQASDWVRENVFPHLQDMVDPVRMDVHKSNEEIAKELIIFMDKDPEIWAYYADYDWVVLCQLFGTMMDLPKGWPMYCRDVKQLCDDRGNPKLPRKSGIQHHALSDAKWTKTAWHFLKKN